MEQRVLKLIVFGCGGGGVGKSTIVIRETRGILVKGYDPTVEDNFSITTNVAGEQVVLDILDTTEVDTYYSILNQQINQSDGFVIAYSITDHLSFEQIKDIMNEYFW